MWVSCVSMCPLKACVAFVLHATHSMFLYFIMLCLQGVFFFFCICFVGSVCSVCLYLHHSSLFGYVVSVCSVHVVKLMRPLSIFASLVFLLMFSRVAGGLSSLGHHVCHYLLPFTQLQLASVYSYFIRNLWNEVVFFFTVQSTYIMQLCTFLLEVIAVLCTFTHARIQGVDSLTKW